MTEEKRKKEGKGGTLRGSPLPTDPVELPIEDSLDLHSFRPQDVRSVVDEYLTAAHARGFTEVRLIHGRGIGVQRKIVQAVLARHPRVAGYANAPPERGGVGATIVRLRISAG